MTAFYIAARYGRWQEMQGYREQLEALGHTVTSRWINGTHSLRDDDPTLEFRAQMAMEDLDDLENADALICFTEPPGNIHGRGGRHVEFGYALAMHRTTSRALGGGFLPLHVIGYRENVFHCLPYVDFFDDWPAFLKHLTHRPFTQPKMSII